MIRNTAGKYLEPLPADCPPDEAQDITVQMMVYRLVRTNIPTMSDFRSQREEKPYRKFHVSECRARGLSVYLKREDSQYAAMLPALRGRLICKVRLSPGAGAIQQTGSRSHHTWWPLARFNILRSIVEVE